MFDIFLYKQGENYIKNETKQFISYSYNVLNNKISITFIILSVIIPFVLNLNFNFEIIDNDNLKIICRILFIASIIVKSNYRILSSRRLSVQKKWCTNANCYVEKGKTEKCFNCKHKIYVRKF